MGIIGLYAAYKIGKRSAERKLDSELESHDFFDLDEVCALCDNALRFHSNDANLSCPVSI